MKKGQPIADLEQTREKSTTGVLLPYQQAWVADQAEVKFIEKSRRVGISWAEASDAALHAAKTKGSDVWYIGYNKEMAEEFISDVAFWARNYALAASKMEEFVFVDEYKDILAYKVRFASGHTVTALSSRPTNLRGKKGRLIIDEAAFHDDLAGLLKAGLAFLVWGGSVRVISTHFGEDNDFNSLVQDIRAGRKPYSLHRVDFDDALHDGLYRRICQVLGRTWSKQAEAAWRQQMVEAYGDDADEELFCIPSSSTGIYLSTSLIEACMSPGLPVLRWAVKDEFTLLPDQEREAEAKAWLEANVKSILESLDSRRRSFFGLDFARTGDLTVLIALLEKQNLTYDAALYLEMANMPFNQQEQALFYIGNRLPRLSGGALDARGNGQFLAERAVQQWGPDRIEAVMLSEAWYRANMPRYKAAFEDRSIRLAKDADILADHRAFQMVRGVARLSEKRTRGADKRQRHGDAGIAGALAWYARGFDVAELPEITRGPERETVKQLEMY